MSLKNKSAKDLLNLTKKLVPPLLPQFHKGQGMCLDRFYYTGAPYFAAHAAAVFGADLSHIICEKNAATVIKSYTPDLMVHPYLYEKDNVPDHVQNIDEFLESKVLPKVKSLLSRIHVAIVGPGLGRDELMLKTLEIVIGYLKEKQIPIIFDADGLYLLSQKPGLVHGYQLATLTPNVVEFKRLADAVGLDLDGRNPHQEASDLSNLLGGVTILRKGAVDIIAQYDQVIESNTKGSDRRSGGQGDTLTGTLATLTAWGESYKSFLWDHDGDVEEEDISLLAAFGASTATRVAAREAFRQKGRAMQATDLHANVGRAYQIVFEEENELFE
ncbi:Carbohydrate kinase domain-containing protein [Wickerhamomyces ciferrii]|uniref:ATP-dependent (S)-NAD(P)H-hydrate dehydratase n=1 Tax=Wickerhamomyces ciferrii (strain ATCC 14091 / BCRC 22168 / CBS 111 / JCM 3599 / NBRC 0793 / NRRL Y-1031 F-60-10) TaxID=1206466 RepID=K0KF57_WICCF|nr:Carbohydrate kinase domain-containing protein [Wickerhamomyces ciferrii]CCH40852.1 Carbohydrate kinase domain-containing protein [Wickerhamomyces ciferrii]